MAKFFIDRPIFAWVIAIILMLAGMASIFTLPVAQYPTIAPLLALVRQRIDAGLPILGICLGAQFIARALGARVYPAAQHELGWAPLTLTDAGRASPLRHLDGATTSMLHWHGDTFDLPRNARRLAFNENYDNQAFALGRSALALQFHLEAEARQLEEWYVGHAVELAAAGIDVNALRAASRANSEAAHRLAQSVFGKWLADLFPDAAMDGGEAGRIAAG
jgi:GMP synthase (glutamine-hydrolysing)